jgi:hypothetical protein
MTPFIYFVDTDQATRVDIQNAKQITDPKILEMMIIGFLAYRVDCMTCPGIFGPVIT